MKNAWSLFFNITKSILKAACFSFIIVLIISLFISKDLMDFGNSKNEIL